MNNELNIHPNLERLFLGCINSDFCNQIFILQHFLFFEIYKICKPLHLSKFKNFQQKIVHMLCKLNFELYWISHFVELILPFWGVISMNFCRNFATNPRKWKEVLVVIFADFWNNISAKRCVNSSKFSKPKKKFNIYASIFIRLLGPCRIRNSMPRERPQICRRALWPTKMLMKNDLSP